MPAGAQQAEPAGALADEVRRRLEARAVGDAARRDEADLLGGGAYQAASSATSRAVSSSSTDHGEPGARISRGGAARRLRAAARAAASGTRARAGSAGLERARELSDAGLCGDLVRDGREVREVEVDCLAHAGRRGSAALADTGPASCRIASGGVKDTLLDELCDWLRIPSISSGGGDPADLRRAAEWACERIVAAGGAGEVLSGYGNPLCVGELRSPRAPTRRPC